MTAGLSVKSVGSRTICLPISEEEYSEVITDPALFRKKLLELFDEMPGIFPSGFAAGFELKDRRVSEKMQITIRRIVLRDGTAYTCQPSFVMPYMTARTENVEKALFLRKFGVPFWALSEVFGRNRMYWFRLETSLGRNSVVGTTVRTAEVPKDVLADEHHQTRNGAKNYVATTVAGGCCLGAEVSESASIAHLQVAYGVFKEEAQDVQPDYTPTTVNTDGWWGTQGAWKALFPTIVILQCFLHAWLKVRDRAKHLKETYGTIRQKIWDAYHASNRRSFCQQIRRLKEWGTGTLTGIVLETVLDLCKKKDKWKIAYDYPDGHRTSNMLDRVMRSMNRYFFDGQHLHGSLETSTRHCRAWALIYNFAPWSPETTKANDGWQSPAERLNKKSYHQSWLQNLLVSASLNGRRTAPQNP